MKFLTSGKVKDIYQLDDDGIDVSTPYLPLALVRGARIYSNRGFDNFDISFYDE